MFGPKSLEVVWNDDEVRAVSKPFVTEVSCRLIAQMDFDLQVWGYRPVENRIVRPAVLFVRPLPLWLIAKTKERVRAGLLNLALWAFNHGWFHFTGPEETIPRWRDVRPGPGSGY